MDFFHFEKRESTNMQVLYEDIVYYLIFKEKTHEIGLAVG